MARYEVRNHATNRILSDYDDPQSAMSACLRAQISSDDWIVVVCTDRHDPLATDQGFLFDPRCGALYGPSRLIPVLNRAKDRWTFDPTFCATGNDASDLFDGEPERWSMMVVDNSYPIRGILKSRAYTFHPAYVGGTDDCPEHRPAFWGKSFPTESDLIAEMDWAHAQGYVVRDHRRVRFLGVI